MSKATIAGLIGAAALLTACAEREVILPGERLGVREVLQTRGTERDVALPGTSNEARAIALPPQVSNADWPQSGVSPHVRVAHAAFSGTLQPLWSAPIGAGDSRRARILADPVAGQGRVFTMDSRSEVRATSTSGDTLWTASVVPARDDAEQAQGGGLALGDGKLFVTSGFGTLTALDPASGAELWVQRLGAPATGQPSYRDGLVYVTSGDQTGWAIEAGDGRVRWRAEGVADIDNVAGAPAPAVGDDLVLFSYGDGTVTAAFRQGGLRRWSADVAGRRAGVALANVNDLTGDPIIVGDTVYAGTHAGRMVALGLGSGERRWTAQMGALDAAWPAGDSVFAVSDRNTLVRLDAATGDTVWEVELPGWQPERRPQNRRDRAFANHGPILAGGRLIVASSDGALRAFNPEDGTLVTQAEIPGGATTRPIVAGGTLYVVSGRGQLHAFR